MGRNTVFIACGIAGIALTCSARAVQQGASKPHATGEKHVNFRQPARQYKPVEVDGRTILVEKQLLAEAPGLARRASQRLVKNVDLALAKLPPHARVRLARIPFYLMYGSRARGGGRDNGLEYFQKQAPARHEELDENWGSSIVIYSAENYATISDFWALKAVLHELAHAYQLEQWPEKQPDILRAWTHAMSAGLHHNVKDDKGEVLPTSYATTNQLEYFAELSCMYFVGCNYQPFDREQLRSYDPDGFYMVEKMWNVDDRTVDIGNRLELFVDDFLIEKRTGDVEQHLHRPEPKEVVLTTDAPWEGNTSAYYTLFRDGDRYRMYYRGSHHSVKRKAAHDAVTCYAESTDGIHWRKPELGLFEFNSSKKNNIVWDGIGTHDFVAFKDGNPDCPPEARYKGIARGHPQGKRGLYIFQSPDGLRWKLMRPGPVITVGAFDSQNVAFWDPQIKLYREYHRTFVQGKRAIMTGTSKDYVNWTQPVLLTYGKAPVEQLYTNAVRPYDRAPHILLGFPTRYLPREGQRVEPTFMASRDGVTFTRWMQAVIPKNAPEDRTGNRSNYMAWGVVELPDRPGHLSVYASEAYYTGPDSRLRRFEYRKDGFVSLRGGAKGGELLTRPIVLGKLAERLVVNFATDKGGVIRVALESPDGKAIPGYGLDDCPPLRGDSIAETIRWNPGQDISPLKGKTVRLRFALKNADLFSIQFQPWLR